MTFHPAKCSVIRISTNKRQIINTSYQLHGHTLEVIDSSKYLSVTISEDLTWRKRIEDSATKANTTLGFVRRNLSECTSKVKYVAYTTMVRPRLEYSSTVWDPHPTSDVHTLEQVQRRAARFVHRNYTQRTLGYVTNMVQSLGWESIQQRRYMDRLSMLFKIQHGLVDISPSSFSQVTAATEDHSAYDSLRPTRTYTDSPSILGQSAAGTVCLYQSSTASLSKDSGKP